MGKISNGLLGVATGKVGGVVGRTWKGINTLSAYQPNVANPQTAGQVGQRTKMSGIVAFAVLINTAIIKPLWDRFAKQMSGYNSFIQSNIAAVSAAGVIDFTKIKTSIGKMTATPQTSPTESAGKITCHWPTTKTDAYQLDTDQAYIVVVQDETGVVLVSTGVARSVGCAQTAAFEDAGGTFHVFLAFRRVDGTVVSDSSYASLTQ